MMESLPEQGGDAGRGVAREAGSLRVSARERDDVATRLQAAYAQGMLDETEFDTRVNAALAAKTRSELYPLTEDLPETPPAGLKPVAKPAGRFITGYGSTVERKGRWTVPSRLRPIIFKGRALIDLRAASLTSEETQVSVTAYKSTIEIIVPPGVGVDARGFAYKGGWIDETEDHPHDAAGRTIRVRGLAYKSKVIIRRSPEA